METNSVLKRTTRYVSGGQTEVNSLGLEWWERINIERAIDDQLFIIDETTAGRLDRIAHEYLGDSRLWWIIAQFNNILDVHEEVVVGAEIYIPSKERVKLLLNGKTGGIPSTREVKTNTLPIV